MATLAAALAAALGYTVGHGLIVGWTFVAPSEKRDWLPYVCLGVAMLAALEAAYPARVWLRWGLRALVTAMAVWLVVRPQSALSLGGMTLGVAALWLAVDVPAGRRGGVGPCLTGIVALVAASGVLVLSGSASFGQLAGVAVACLASLALVAWRNPDVVFLPGASGAFVLIPATLWLNLRSYSYAEVPVASALIPGARHLVLPGSHIATVAGGPGRDPVAMLRAGLAALLSAARPPAA